MKFNRSIIGILVIVISILVMIGLIALIAILIKSNCKFQLNKSLHIKEFFFLLQ